MNLIYFAIFAACACLVNAQSACLTPSGQQSECISLDNCQPLLNLVNKKDKTSQDYDLLRKSHCGFEENVATKVRVCCPKPVRALESQNNICYTPEGNVGECISLFSCPHLKEMLKPPAPKENVAYMKTVRCKGLDHYSVCCGPPVNNPARTWTDPETVTRGNCEDKMSAFPPDPSSGCCGIDSSFGNKIVGGNATTIDQYPWLVVIEYIKLGVTRLSCGGALISGKYVLTAGHCVAGRIVESNGTPKRVRLGEYDTLHEGPDCVGTEAGGEDCTEGVKRIRIEKTIPHPQYNYTDPNKWNDIALIRLMDTAPFTDFIRPICLPTKDLTLPQNRPANFPLYAAGWGAVSLRQSSSNIKLHVKLPLMKPEDCEQAYLRTFDRITSLWKRQLCVGGQSGEDSCSGDSGGPLMYEGESVTEVVGIVSYGPTICGQEGVPGVYSKTYEYLDWIRNTIVP